MLKYVALGCSLTSQFGFVNYLNDNYNLGIVNLAVSAGSNQLQDLRLSNCLINGEIDHNTTLIWQITSPNRYYDIMSKESATDYCHGTPHFGSFNWSPEELSLFNTSRIVLLCNNNYFKHRQIPDTLAEMQEVVMNLYKWSFIVKRIVVSIGWADMLNELPLKQAIEFLRSKDNIDVIPPELGILTWCKNQGLELADDNHPTEESYIQWGERILLPYLQV